MSKRPCLCGKRSDRLSPMALGLRLCVNAVRPGLGFIAWQLPSLAGPSLLAPPRRLCRRAVPSAAGRCNGQVRAGSPPAVLSGAAIHGLCQGLLPNAISGREPKAENPPALPPSSPASPLLQRVRAGDALPPVCTVPTGPTPPKSLPLASPGPTGEASVLRACAWGDEGVRVPQSSLCSRSQTSSGFVRLGLSPAAKSAETSFTGSTSCFDPLSLSSCVGRGLRLSLGHGKSLSLPA